MNRPTARRQTLGPVSVNVGVEKAGQRRLSVGPSSIVPPKTRPPTGRPSIVPRAGRENPIPPTPPSTGLRRDSTVRRSSVGGDRGQANALPPPTAPTKLDPRQVSEKSFQQNCIKKLLRYLIDHGYEHPITHKSLARPSGKDFYHIVTFLFRQVDPNFQDGTMKIEDEIAMNFKALGYPFPVSKTSLVAAGSPHAWPSLLAAVTWLTERIHFMKMIVPDTINSDLFESLEELEVKTDKAFFRYLSASYTAFLQGDENATEELELDLAVQFERDDVIIEREIEQMTDKNAVMVEQINNLTMGENDLREYLNKRDGYNTDLAQFHDLIDQMDNHVKMLHQKKNDRIAELEESTAKLGQTNAKIDSLKDAVKSQKLSLEESHHLQNTVKGMSEAINRLQGLTDSRRSTLSRLSSDQQRLWNSIEEIVPVFNSATREMSSLVPTVAGEAFKLNSTNNSVSSGTLVLGHGLEEEIQAHLLSSREGLMASLVQAKRDYQQRLDELAQMEGRLIEALQSFKIIDDKIVAREAVIYQERDANGAKCAVRLREAEVMEAKVSSLRDPVALEKRLTQYETQCTELESLRSRSLETSSAMVRAVLSEIESASAAMDRFDEFLFSTIQECQVYRSGSRSSFSLPQIGPR